MSGKKKIAVKSQNNNSTKRATALVSMSAAEKKKLTSVAKAHGLSLSAFFRLAATEYITEHNWQRGQE